MHPLSPESTPSRSRHPEGTLHIAYLLTTFPAPSEIFIQRELRMLKACGDITLDIHSLWQGASSWEGYPVQRFGTAAFARILYRLPRQLLTKPEPLLQALHTVLQHPPQYALNATETLAGLGFATVQAERLAKSGTTWIHAGWATMPATAAWLLHRITGIPFSMGAHAYDVFQSGGDCLLAVKLRQAAFIHTTTEYARTRLLQCGAEPDKVCLIRRGLDRFPAFIPPRPRRTPLRLISAGRFVEKKGWIEQLHIFAACARAGLRFQARIIGDGPMADEIRRTHRRLGLESCVRIIGWLKPDALLAARADADVCIFTGKIAANGDRDGLPNVIPEAMASGRLVVATPVAGVPEAIRDGETGFLCPLNDPPAWLRILQRIQRDDALCHTVAENALGWVQAHYDNRRNTRQLLDQLRQRSHSKPIDTRGA